MRQPMQEPKTYLTEDTIKGLKAIFATEGDYIAHMETLWVLRELSMKTTEYQNENGETCYNTQSPHFKIYKLTNDLIGALLQDGINLLSTGNAVQHFKTK